MGARDSPLPVPQLAKLSSVGMVTGRHRKSKGPVGPLRLGGRKGCVPALGALCGCWQPLDCHFLGQPEMAESLQEVDPIFLRGGASQSIFLLQKTIVLLCR